MFKIDGLRFELGCDPILRLFCKFWVITLLRLWHDDENSTVQIRAYTIVEQEQDREQKQKSSQANHFQVSSNVNFLSFVRMIFFRRFKYWTDDVKVREVRPRRVERGESQKWGRLWNVKFNSVEKCWKKRFFLKWARSQPLSLFFQTVNCKLFNKVADD